MKTKEDNHEAFNGISFLSETAINFTTAGINQRIYTYIGSCLSKLNPDAYILVNSLDDENKLVRNEALITNSQTLEKIISTLRFNPKQKTFPFDDSIFDLIKGAVTKFEYGIHEMSFKTIPKSIASALEIVLNIGEIYGIAFVAEGRIYAVAALIFPKGKKIQHIEIIEIFVRQASVTLKRIDAEKNEEKYRRLFEFMSQGAFYQKADGHLTDVNDAALKMFGLSRVEFLNNDPQNAVWDVIDENFLAVPTEYTPSIIALKEGSPVNNRILGVFNPQKQDYVWMTINAIPEFNEGETKPYRVFVTMHDVTELKNKETALKKSEEKYKTLFNNSMTGMFRSKIDGSAILDLNQKAAETFGFTIDEMLDSPSAIHYANAKDREEVIRLLKEKGSFTDHEVAFRTKTAEIKNVLMACRADFEQEILEGSFIDITERKHIEKKTLEHQQLLKSVTSEVQAILFALDTNGVFTFSDGRGLENLGLKPAQVVGMSAVELYRDNPNILDAVEKSLKGINVKTESLEVAGFYYDTIFQPIFDNEGIVISVIGLAIDVTETKKIERELLQSKRELSTLMDNMPGMVYTCENDDKWTMKFISVGSFELTGYRPEELIDNKEISYDELIHTDDRQKVWDEIQASILKEKPFNIEYRIITKHGQVKHVWERGSLQYDSEKKKNLLEGFITDISEKKEFEEALQSNYSLMRMAGKTARFGGWSVDFETNTVLWSDQVKEIHEMPKEYMPIVEEGISFYAPEWKEKITRIFTDCAQNGIPYDEEMEIITGKGRRIWIRTTGEAVWDESGKITKVHGSFQDIHDYKLITEALKENEARLDELNATKDKFFSIIAHDLRSPFAGIMGLSEILVDNIQEKDYENTERIGSLILDSSQKALALLTNLLEWSRSQSGRMEFLPEYLQIVPLIKETAALFNEAAVQKSITIDFQLPKNPIVFLDKAMISTVLRNLISNAVKFTRPHGKIIIKLNISSEACELSVQDNGVGIPKEHLEKLFRIEESYSTRGTNNEKGTGLGLILSKEFVEKHGGHIHAISKEGFGSTFSFTIPFNKSNNISL
jgi:PAS domain S-box-containing protein